MSNVFVKGVKIYICNGCYFGFIKNFKILYKITELVIADFI